MFNQKGQIALIIILIMTAALGVGLSIIQRSLSDITTSSKVEQSSRAFSAAEAGIERALHASTNDNFSVSNSELQNAKTDVSVRGNAAWETIELDPFSKEQIAQIWFISPKDLITTPYTGSDFTLYYGNSGNVSDKPAIEVNVITKDALGKFNANRYYFDSNSARIPANGFDTSSSNCNGFSGIATTRPDGGNFLCRVLISGYQASGTPILARIRVLYSNSPQAIALAPRAGFTLPPNQVKIITSVGSAGETQRIVRVTTQENVVPPLLDYALFSINGIQK